MSPRTVRSLVAAVKHDIAEVAKRAPGAEKSTAAALALELAGCVAGDPHSEFPDPLAARVSAARELREIMTALAESAPAEKQADRLDELTARRAARKASA